MNASTPGAGSANPTNVSSFTGLSDSQVAESHFENLWNRGAFNADGKPDAQQGQAPPAPDSAAPPATAQSEQEATPAPEPEPEGPDYASLDDYLTQSKIERDSFYELPVSVKIDGKTSQAKLADLIKSYQLEGHVNAKSIALAEKQREWEGQQAAARQALEQQLQGAKALGDLAHQQLLGQYNSIDWNKLRADDPAQWAVLNTEFNQRANAIQQHLAAVADQQQKLVSEQQQRLAAEIPKEREKMYEARPEWRDDAKFAAARQEMVPFARKMGFTDAEIQSIYDHRYMLVLDMAAQYARLQAQAPQAVKRVRTAPQMAQPGARISRDPTAVALNNAREQFRKAPRDTDAQTRYFDQLARSGA